MNVLIVDDNSVKTDKISRILHELGVANGNVTVRQSVFQAKRSLTQNKYNVMILDLMLPNREDSDTLVNGGHELLNELKYLEGIYKMPDHVFVLSEFDEAIHRLDDVEDLVHYGLIRYRSDDDEWVERLKNFIEQIMRTDRDVVNSYGYDVAIVCALEDPELVEVKKLPFNWKPRSILGDSTDYYTGTYKEHKLICAASYEMGMSSAAILTTKMIHLFHPKYVIMAGIAGGVDKGPYHYGDVMVADPCFDYNSGKNVNVNGKSGFNPDYRQIRLDDSAVTVLRRVATKKDLLSQIKNNCMYEKPEADLSIFIGPFASGAAVVSDPNIINNIIKYNRKLLGFDMEAYAVMLSGYIAPSPKPIPIIIKAISDFGTGKTDQYQKYAAYTSARVVEAVIDEILGGG